MDSTTPQGTAPSGAGQTQGGMTFDSTPVQGSNPSQPQQSNSPTSTSSVPQGMTFDSTPVQAPHSSPAPQSNSSAQPEQSGFLDRLEQTSIGHILTPLVQKPIDAIADVEDLFASGQTKAALTKAYDTYNKLHADNPNNPITVAMGNIITNYGQHVADTYGEARRAGHGVVASAADSVTGMRKRVEKLEGAIHQASQDMKAGNYMKATTGLGSALLPVPTETLNPVHAVKALGGPGSDLIAQDVKAGNYTGALGDALGIATNVGALLIPEAEGAKGAVEGTEAAEKANAFVQAHRAVLDAQEAAARAPGDVAAKNQLQNALTDYHQATIDRLNQNYAAAHDQIESQHLAATNDAEQTRLLSDHLADTNEQAVKNIASGAPTDNQITDSVRNATNTANKEMHQRYAASHQQLQDLTKNTSLPFTGSNTHNAAIELLGQGKAEGPLTQAVSKSLPGSEKANTILNNLVDTADTEPGAADTIKDAEGNELTPEQVDALHSAYGFEPNSAAPTMLDKPATTTTMPDLLKAYQKLGENSRNVGWASPSALADQQIYNRLKKGILDDISTLANKSGNPDAIDIAENMNKDYRENVGLYDNPAVKALREGNLNDVDARLSGRQSSIGDIEAFKGILGQKGFTDFANNSLRRMVANAIGDDGTLNYKKLLTKLNGMNPDVRKALYGDLGSGVTDALNNIKLGTQQSEDAANALKTVDKTRQASLEGIGKTEQGAKGVVNKAIQDVMGDGDITKILKDPVRSEAVRDALGTDGVRKLVKMNLDNVIAKASTDVGGKKVPVRPEEVLNYLEQFKDVPDAQNLFKIDDETAQAYNKVISQMQDIKKVKNLIQKGVLPAAIGAGAGLVGSHVSPIVAAIGTLGLPSAAIKFGGTEQLVNYFAEHPKFWDSVGAIGRATSSPGKVIKTLPATVGKAVTTTVEKALPATVGKAVSTVGSPARSALSSSAGKAALVSAESKLSGNQ